MKKFPEINLENYLIDFNGFKYSISFVGNPYEETCLDVLCYLSKIYKSKLHIFSSLKDFSKSIDKIKQKNLLTEDEIAVYSKCRNDFDNSEDELAQIFISSKINLNINEKKRTSSNRMLFETLAAGGFAITNEKEDLEKYFDISKQVETFKNNSDLVDKIDFYLQNLNLTQKIAQLGKYEVIKNQKSPIKLKKSFFE